MTEADVLEIVKLVSFGINNTYKVNKLQNVYVLFDKKEKRFLIPTERYYEILQKCHQINHFSQTKTKEIILFPTMALKYVEYFWLNCCSCSEYNQNISQIHKKAILSK